MSSGARTAVVAWLITAIYYFYQYALRSAPAVMMPQLSAAFGLSAMGVASMAGLFYYGYSPFSLIAGVALDRLGPRSVVPIGAATVADVDESRNIDVIIAAADGSSPQWAVSAHNVS